MHDSGAISTRLWSILGILLKQMITTLTGAWPLGSNCWTSHEAKGGRAKRLFRSLIVRTRDRHCTRRFLLTWNLFECCCLAWNSFLECFLGETIEIQKVLLWKFAILMFILKIFLHFLLEYMIKELEQMNSMFLLDLISLLRLWIALAARVFFAWRANRKKLDATSTVNVITLKILWGLITLESKSHIQYPQREGRKK